VRYVFNLAPGSPPSHLPLHEWIRLPLHERIRAPSCDTYKIQVSRVIAHQHRHGSWRGSRLLRAHRGLVSRTSSRVHRSRPTHPQTSRWAVAKPTRRFRLRFLGFGVRGLVFGEIRRCIVVDSCEAKRVLQSSHRIRTAVGVEVDGKPRKGTVGQCGGCGGLMIQGAGDGRFTSIARATKDAILTLPLSSCDISLWLQACAPACEQRACVHACCEFMPARDKHARASEHGATEFQTRCQRPSQACASHSS
jgi:hypothetical protein